jgi:hypothetical protein
MITYNNYYGGIHQMPDIMLKKKYNTMLDAFKGHFTIDEKGNSVQLWSLEETAKMIDEFWGRV